MKTTFSELIQRETPVLVDFYADWCGPCKAMSPILKEAAAELGDRVTVVKVNVDNAQQAATRFGVQSIPTLILFRSGKPIWRHSGLLSKRELVTAVSQRI